MIIIMQLLFKVRKIFDIFHYLQRITQKRTLKHTGKDILKLYYAADYNIASSREEKLNV